MKLRVACVQFNATEDVARNTARSISYIQQAARRKVKFLAFPESFHFRGDTSLYKIVAEPIPSAKTKLYADLARHYRMAILLGSLHERCVKPNKCYNTSVLISEKGKIEARYRKRHLFVARLKTETVRESRHFLPGKKDSMGKVFGVKVALSICFDLRFPDLYKRFCEKGAMIACVPSNFTAETGKAHWEILLRSRAIENQFFIVAPDQCGRDPVTGQASYGNSMIIDPWGKVIARAGGRKEGLVIGDIDLSELGRVRKRVVIT